MDFDRVPVLVILEFPSIELKKNRALVEIDKTRAFTNYILVS